MIPFLSKNRASVFYIKMETPCFEEIESFHTGTFSAQINCKIWPLRDFHVLLLFSKAICHVYGEILAVTAQRIVFNNNIFSILERCSPETLPNIWLLGATEAHTVCADAIIHAYREAFYSNALLHCHFFLKTMRHASLLNRPLTRSSLSAWSYDIILFHMSDQRLKMLFHFKHVTNYMTTVSFTINHHPKHCFLLFLKSCFHVLNRKLCHFSPVSDREYVLHRVASQILEILLLTWELW